MPTPASAVETQRAAYGAALIDGREGLPALLVHAAALAVALTANGRARTELATKSPLADVKGLGNPHHFLADVKGLGNPHHFLAGGQGALPQNSQGRPWTGDHVFASGDDRQDEQVARLDDAMTRLERSST